jgi:hypothetical protein
MAHTKTCLVVLATAWGSRHGGLNAFNFDWVRSLGIAPRREYELVCVVLKATEQDIKEAKAEHHVTLLSMDLEEDDLDPVHALAVLNAIRLNLGQALADSNVVWLGHDNKTGPIAIALRQTVPGSRAVVLSHMAFGLYQGVKTEGKGADAKKTKQEALFEQADMCFAIGPMLFKHLEDTLSVSKRAFLKMLVPGLADVDPAVLRSEPPQVFSALIAGRLGSEDERIKQALLGVRGFGCAVRQNREKTAQVSPIPVAPVLRMRGVLDDQHKQVRDVVSEAAGGFVECDLKPYVEDRTEYFSDLANSSVVMMPSWHEGFGLVAWEAIAYQVPVIIGMQSGVRVLLDEIELGTGIGKSVHCVLVQGKYGDSGQPAHTEEDVKAVATALCKHLDKPLETKAAAVRLAEKLSQTYTWTQCAQETLSALEEHLSLRLQQKLQGSVDCVEQPAETGTTAAGVMIPKTGIVPASLAPPTSRLKSTVHQLGPSALLAASDQVVRFSPLRRGFVDSLLASASASGAPKLTIQGLYGPGGIGKTRTALELLKIAADVGWNGVWLPTRQLDAALASWKELLAKGPNRLLLVVDYAEGRQAELLRWLAAALDNVLHSKHAARVHVLCLSRGQDWWEQLSRQPECSEQLSQLLSEPKACLKGIAVPSWSSDIAHREEAFRAALEDYADAMGQVVPSYAWRPDLTSVHYERPVYIHLAALAALAGEHSTHDSGLLKAQLDREWKHWQRTAPEGFVDVGAWENWADALALISLCQGLSTDELSEGLKSLGYDKADGWAKALSLGFADGSGGVIPLAPDVLAEHLIMQRLANERATAWLKVCFEQTSMRLARSMEVVARIWVVLRNKEVQQLDKAALRLIDGLAACWPKQGNDLVDAVRRHGFPLDQPVTLAWGKMSSLVQVNVAQTLDFPDNSTVLMKLAVEVNRKRVEAIENPEQRDREVLRLAQSLRALGDADSKAEALRLTKDVLDCQAYDPKDPPQKRAHFAKVLSSHANHLYDPRDAESTAVALRMRQEALKIYESIDEMHDPDYRVDHATVLHNLACHIFEQKIVTLRTVAGRYLERAIQLRFQLSAAGYAHDADSLASSLSLLAVGILDDIDSAASNDQLHTSQTSLMLSNLTLDESAQRALILAENGVQLRRILALEDPSAYLPKLGISLLTLARALAYQINSPNHRLHARDRAREAVAIFGMLESNLPKAFGDLLLKAEGTLSIVEANLLRSHIK